MNHRTALPTRADGTVDIVALLARNHALFGDLKMTHGDGEGGATDGAGDGAAGSGGSGDGGKAYVAPSTQEELDALIDRRLSRERSKYSKFDEYKTKAEKHDALEAELGTAADKAAAKARDEERAKNTAESVPRLVKAEFKAAAKGVLTDEQLTALLEDLDLSKYVTDSGDIDDDKVEKKVKAFAPADAGKGGNNGNQGRNLGQGNHQQANPKPGDRGRAEAEKRFAKKA